VVGDFLRAVRVRLLGLLLELIPSPSARTGAHCAADDRAWRAGDRPADGRATNRAGCPAGPGSCSLITFGCLARDRTAGRPNRSADCRANGSTNHAADDSSTNGATSPADRFAGMLLIVRSGAL
jgi:hypothetical protein